MISPPLVPEEADKTGLVGAWPSRVTVALDVSLVTMPFAVFRCVIAVTSPVTR